MDSTEKATFSSGATSSTEKPRYDLIPLIALRRLADRFGYGAKKHGDHNYKSGYNDPDFIRDRKNHMLEHVAKYISGDRTTDHLGAIMCNAAMLAEMERIAETAEIDKQFWADLMPGTIIPHEGGGPSMREAAQIQMRTGLGATRGRTMPAESREATALEELWYVPGTTSVCCAHGPKRYICGRISGHAGDHVAYTGPATVVERWSA